ncbi:MAG: alkaline phosphatase PhoX, partial [Angustibacter sp.]
MAAAPSRSLLPMTQPVHSGGRSAMTCHWRCADACAKPDANTSDNPTFGEVVQAALSRRSLLRAAGATVATGAALTASRTTPAAAATPGASRFNFRGIAPQPAELDELVVPRGYEWSTIISWGDPILPGAPDFDFDAQTAKAQAGQFGYNNDYTTLIPIGRGRAILVCNNEYTNEELMVRG